MLLGTLNLMMSCIFPFLELLLNRMPNAWTFEEPTSISPTVSDQPAPSSHISTLSPQVEFSTRPCSICPDSDSLNLETPTQIAPTSTRESIAPSSHGADHGAQPPPQSRPPHVVI